MHGIHIIADLQNIDFEKLEINEKKLQTFFSKIIKKHNLTELGNYYKTFGKKNEITGVIALSESHITFHSWPEFSYISFDIFVCNFKNNNSKNAENIFKEVIGFFECKDFEKKVIERKN